MRIEARHKRMQQLLRIRELSLVAAEADAGRGRFLLGSLETEERERALEAAADLKGWMEARAERFDPHLAPLWSVAVNESARRQQLAAQLVVRAKTELRRRNDAWRRALSLKDACRDEADAATKELWRKRDEHVLAEQDERSLRRSLCK
jgi:ribosomal protein S18 acetylase RimI-like enzyme